MKIKYTG